jgi:hypothetical protein
VKFLHLKAYTYICCCVLLVASCAGTELTRTLVYPAFKGEPVSNILVIAVTNQKDTRRLFEQKFVAQLKAAGIRAVSSMEAIPMPSDLKIEKQTVLAAVRQFENDAVIVTHMAGKEEKEVYTRGSYEGLGFYNNYGRIYNYANDPGYSSSKTNVRLETNLYDIKTEKLIWSGQSKSWDIDTRNQVIDEVIQVVIHDLQKNKIIPSK